MNSSDPSAWLVCARPAPAARARLFCVPFAGGDASIFRTWADDLPADVEVHGVELPGTLRRFGEPPCTRMAPLVEELCRAVAPLLDRPYAFFGSCTGSFVAFETCVRLAQLYGKQPARFVCSSVWAPHLPSRHAPIHHLDGDAFLAALASLGAMPRGTLAQPELVRLLLPSARASFEVAETYTCDADALLACPLTAICGRGDPLVSEAEIAAWSARTTGATRTILLDGGHALWDESRRPLLDAIAHALAAVDPSEETLLRR